MDLKDFDKLSDRLRSLNWHYGKGDIVKIDCNLNGNEGVVTRKPFGMTEEKRKFRIVKNTVFFLGHQSDFSKPIKL